MITRIFSICLLSSAIAFTPQFIGPSFRESNKLLPDEDYEMSKICGRQKKSEEKAFPWAISILLNGQNRLGGSIISPYHILTVAHGFMDFTDRNAEPCVNIAHRTISELRNHREIVYGGNCIRGNSQFFPNDPKCPHANVMRNKIRSVLIDAHFSDYGCHDGHDFAIIELEHRIEFSDRVHPICLPWNNMTLDSILSVSSWGRSSIFRLGGPLIREIPMKIDKYCRRPWSDRLPFKVDDLLCAVSLNTSDYSSPRTCHGDSGSGMEQRDESGRAFLVGLTSFGTRGCPMNELARFTRVDRYLKNICEYTGVCYSTTANFKLH